DTRADRGRDPDHHAAVRGARRRAHAPQHGAVRRRGDAEAAVGTTRAPVRCGALQTRDRPKLRALGGPGSAVHHSRALAGASTTRVGWRALALHRIRDTRDYVPAGGGRNTTSCLAASATTSSGFCSFMLWIAQNRS